jgi:iron complex transport system ATP-binding protein
VVTELRARGVEFAYPSGPRVLDGLDIDVHSGELVAVLGPNGAGKSTLVRVLAGLLTPTAGRVELHTRDAGGRDVTTLAPRERARSVALVPQGLARIPQVRVHDFVLGGRYAHGTLRSREHGRDETVVRAALAACDAADLGERALDQMSGGQRQRILVARALAQEADVLLVDEPTSSLDPEHQLAMFELLARLTCESRAVLVVTHDLNLASQFATRLDVIAGGRVAVSGTADAVLCPEVLHPIYGERLRFGRFPARDGRGDRPFVLPWSQPFAPREETR